MNGFMRTLSIVGVISAILMLHVETASAQIAPRRPAGGNRPGISRGDGGYYGYDTFSPNINQTNAAYQQAWNQQQQNQAQAVQARTSAWQNINQSMAQQANQQTQSMQAERQASRDWWYQQQSRQLAESKARTSQPRSLPSAGYTGIITPDMLEPAVKPVAQEIMLWPTLLKLPQFDVERTKVETPFRRAQADNKPLSTDDYRGILKAIEAMKEKLAGISSQILEAEYAVVEGYLDELAADAQKRLDYRQAPPTGIEKTAEPAAKS